MKKILFSLLLALPLTAVADTYNYLNLTSTESVQSVALKTVKKIIFEGTNIKVITTDDQTVEASLATLSTITFTDIAVGVKDLAQTDRLCIEHGRIVAQGNGLLLLFNASGQLVRQLPSNDGRHEVNLDGLPRGLYIAKLGNKSVKILH
jgi:hypothetical protein